MTQRQPQAVDRAALLASSPVDFVELVRAQPSLLEEEKIQSRYQALLNKASVCSFCGVGCPYTVEDDRKGQAKVHPLSSLGLCVKGQTSLTTGGDQERAQRLKKRGLADDRIRAPMLRGHDGQMREVSWDEALDRAAWLFLHTREWVGPQAVAIYGNGQKTLEDIWMASLYKLVFNLPSIGANSEHCLTSAGAAHILNFGNEASFTWQQFEELAHCDVAILHGTNAFVTFPQAYEKLKRNTRALKVVIDPVRSDTVTDLLKHDPRTSHISFRQGGDILFNLAVARVIFENQWEDTAFLAEKVDEASLQTFKQACFQPSCEPAAAAKLIALPGQDIAAVAATIREHAELIAKPRQGQRPKVAFVSSMGINQSTGSYGFSTNLNLLLLTGNVGRPGAGSMRIAGQSNATSELMMGFNSRKLVFNLDPLNDVHRKKLAEVLSLPLDNIPSATGTPVARMAENDELYCFIFVGTQMTKNMPRVGHWARRMGRAFNIVIDSFLGEGVLEHADVLLPALTYTERTGVIQRGDRTLQLQQSLTEPPEKAWCDSQILARLALKIAERLRDPDTAELNKLDADVVHESFARYLDESGRIDTAIVFDHIVSVNRQLDLYSRLETASGEPITHKMLVERAGQGVQWGGDARYQNNTQFPSLFQAQTQSAKLVVPPETFLQKLAEPLQPGSLFLISGRGRPGRKAVQGRARYNSGIKTLPIYGLDPDEHFVEMHPDQLQQHALVTGAVVKIVSDHAAVVAKVAENDRIPMGAAFIDFVPGEVNRLTNYVDADQFTHQSLIKRTRVKISGLSQLETLFWASPRVSLVAQITQALFTHWRKYFGSDEDWVLLQKEDPDNHNWLSSQVINQPSNEYEHKLSEAVGAFTILFQRYASDKQYKANTAETLRALPASSRHQFLSVFLPLVRRLDYHSIMHPILADFVGGVSLLNEHGQVRSIDLLSSHKAAVLEFKEEIVAIQLYVAIKRGVELLFGENAQVPQARLAFVSGVAIPCAGDVPAHFLGISPADLGAALLVHSRAIGSSALMIVDRVTNRAVRVDVKTGVLPKDKELGYLRGVVINRKRKATAKEHRRFFDRLGELIVQYIRDGDENFSFFGPTAFDWLEYQSKCAFAPANIQKYGQYLVDQRISHELTESLVALGVLDERRDRKVLVQLRQERCTAQWVEGPTLAEEKLYAGTLVERVERVVRTVIEPVLENDGGRLDVLNVDEESGELHVRFVGSCANCPYSLLSMEQIVKPSLEAIPGVERIIHRAKPRAKELIAVSSV